MAGGIEFTAKGAKRVADNFSRLEALLKKRLRQTVTEANLILVEEIKKKGFTQGGYRLKPRERNLHRGKTVRVPTPAPRWPITYRRTGFAARSINHRVEVGMRDTVGIVGGWAPYLRRLELGYRSQKPRRLMRRSMMRRQKEIQKVFERTTAEVLRRG